MEEYYSNDSLTAYTTDDGILIEEKKKGSLKMLLLIMGMGLLMLVGGFLIGMFGGTIGLAMSPWLIWGSIIVLAVGVIAFVIKMAMNQDPKITVNTTTHTITVRGKIIPFSDIETIVSQEQSMMSKTMVFAFMMIGGKKKSLFSTAIVAPDPKEMTNFISNINDMVQKGKLSDAVLEEMDKI
jgi:cytochrome c biogenesis protein CcdA